MYKDKEAQRVANRKANQKYRDNKKGITPDPVIPNENVIPLTVIPDKAVIPSVIPLGANLTDGKYLRYEAYKSGHLHDRIPEEAKKFPAIIEALVDSKRRAAMEAICASLDHEINGVDGRKINLRSEVRYGVEGPTLDVVQKWLEVTA